MSEGIGEIMARERDSAGLEWVIRLAAVAGSDLPARLAAADRDWAKGEAAKRARRSGEGEWSALRAQAGRDALERELGNLLRDASEAERAGREALGRYGVRAEDLAFLEGDGESARLAAKALVQEGISPGVKLALMGISESVRQEVEEGLRRIGKALEGGRAEGDWLEEADGRDKALRELAARAQRVRLEGAAGPGEGRGKRAGL